MASTFSLYPLSLLLLLLLAGAAGSPSDLVRSSCAHATFPTLCFNTLSHYPGPAHTPTDLAQAAVHVSLGRAKNLSAHLAHIKAQFKSKREKAALRDCIEQLADSVDELADTLEELRRLKTGSFRWRMSNAETWVSAALTDMDTCTDGIGGKKGKVRKKIRSVAKVTSNALYLVNRLDGTRGKP